MSDIDTSELRGSVFHFVILFTAIQKLALSYVYTALTQFMLETDKLICFEAKYYTLSYPRIASCNHVLRFILVHIWLHVKV